MAVEPLLRTLLETALAASVAITLVMAVRVPLRRRLGAVAAYALWACVPIAACAVLVPARVAPVEWAALAGGMAVAGVATPVALPAPALGASLALALWALGAVLMALRLRGQQARFVRSLGPLSDLGEGVFVAAASHGLPATIGVLRPRIVLPADFAQRYNGQERALILLHERQHIRRGDLAANLVAALLRCLHWFNPLVHYAARCHRLDQELACDQGVIARRPAARRRYGEAMLKACLDDAPLPLGARWPGRHPLQQRIAQLARAKPSRGQRGLAAALVAACITCVGLASWAAQPARPAQEVESGPPPAPPATPWHDPPPQYPPEAARQHVEGEVMLLLDVAADGTVTMAKVEHAEPAGVFDQAAIEAAKKWKFTPTVRNGRAVPDRVRVPVSFRIDDAPDPASPAATAPAGA
ncbi:MAG: TonB family protein [Pseudoxanthomonas sp.]